MSVRNSGIFFIGLNAVRALSIITLLLLFASSIVNLVADIKAVNAFVSAGKSGSGSSSNNGTNIEDCIMYDCDYIEGSTVPNQPAGAFWAVLNRLLIIFQCVVLIMSEVNWPAAFFNRFFPILGKDFGLGPIGVIQCLLGAAVLSHHVDEFSLVAAFFLFSVGCLNIFLGLVFRERAKAKRSITSWREGSKDVLPSVQDLQHKQPVLEVSSSRSDSMLSKKAGYGFGRQGEKAAAHKGFLLRLPEESVPPYAPKPTANARASSPVFSSNGSAV